MSKGCFSDGSSTIVHKNGKCGIIGLNGEIIVDFIYDEIKKLDPSGIYFSAKLCDDSGERYIIVDNKNEEIKIESGNSENIFNSHFVWYSENRILSSINNHYGFVSISGYISIPFKYDIIKPRKDGAFDVCIKIPIEDGAFDIPKEFEDKWEKDFFIKIWGILDIDGREIVPLKYSNPLPENYDNAIVKDAFSGHNGIIRKDGTEYLPCIYQHLCRFDNFHNKSADPSLLFYGYGGYDDNKYGFFGGYIGGAKWGLLNTNGEVVIEARYDCFKQVGDYLLAGRNGFMLLSGNSEYVLSRKEYSGVYDLYNKDGELIIGGFSMFEEQENCLIFIFGGEWKQRWDEGGNADYDFNQTSAKGNARWLILDKNLKSIIRKRDGSEFVLKKGSICTITQKEVKGRVINYWNFPLEVFSLCKPYFSNGIAIVERDKKQMAVRINDGVTSELYDGIKIIDNNSFFVKVDDNSVSHIGLRSFQETIISPNEGFVFLTNPVQGLVFCVKSDNTLSNTDNVTLLCIDTSTETNTIFTAIEKILFEELVYAMESGDLEIIHTDTDSESIQYYVKDIELFDSTFVECFPYKIQQADKSFYFDNMYWYSDIYELKYTRYEKERRRIEESRASREEQLDYLSDTWDAMTDGMYGDMPDGFDGDYDFLGF